MLKVVHEESGSNETGASVRGSSLLDEIVRDGARRMLAAALEAEVAAYIDAHAGQLDEHGRRLVVLCAAGRRHTGRPGVSCEPGSAGHVRTRRQCGAGTVQA
jgi:hypothetical protein